VQPLNSQRLPVLDKLGLPEPSTSPKDVFRLRETRVVNGYRRISPFNHTIQVPNVEPYENVEIQ
jgi:hypothetical protein